MESGGCLWHQIGMGFSAAVQGAFLDGLPPHRLLVERDLHMIGSLHKWQTQPFIAHTQITSEFRVQSSGIAQREVARSSKQPTGRNTS